MVPSPDGDDDDEWEWVQRFPHHRQESPLQDDDNDNDGFFAGADQGTAGTSTPTWAGMVCLKKTQSSESLSSTVSSPILKHNLAVTVMAKDRISALDALHYSGSEWIEPQLVFSKPLGLHFEGFEIYKLVMYLQELPKAKEVLASLLSDPVVSDAVMSNKAFQELVCKYGDSDQISEGLDSNSECTSSLFYECGKKAYELLKQKLTTAVDILLSLLGRQTFEKNVVDQLDATVKSCILLVAMLVFRVIGKRLEEGMYLAHTI